MPYYRIIFWVRLLQHETASSKTQFKTVQGIRFNDILNIDVVLNQMRIKANAHYGERNVFDVEVQMLSKNCSAVLGYIDACEKRRKAKKDPKVVSLPHRNESRKETYARYASQEYEKKQQEMREQKGNTSPENNS